MSKVEFRLTIVDDGKEVFSEPLTSELMGCIANYYPDKASSLKFFSYACLHPSSDVRQHIAYKDKLDEHCCTLLSRDVAISVLQNLLRNSVFREIATMDILNILINKDPELAQIIASNVEVFKMVDIQNLAEILSSNNDPYVVLALAQNRRSPKKILKKLISHSDISISEAAHENLK